MIVFGGNNLVNYLALDNLMSEPKWYKLNFCNMKNIGTQLEYLFPPYQMLEFYHGTEMDSYDFDMNYARYLMEDDNAFITMMAIVMSEYYNHNTFVLYDDNSAFVENIIDSVIKFLNARYGLHPIIVHEEIDMEFIKDDEYDISCEQNFLDDKERYVYLTTNESELDKESYKMEEISGGTI